MKKLFQWFLFFLCLGFALLYLGFGYLVYAIPNFFRWIAGKLWLISQLLLAGKDLMQDLIFRRGGDK